MDVVVVVVVASFDPLHANFQTNKSLTRDSLVELAKKIQGTDFLYDVCSLEIIV